MTTPEPTPDEADELDVDPWAVIEQIRVNRNIAAEQLAIIEEAHKAYRNAVATNPDVAECGFGFGLLIGAYVNGGDEKVLKRTDELLKRQHQSDKGKKSGELRGARTRERVKQTALEIRRDKPRISRAELGRQVAKGLGKEAPTLKTIDRHLEALEKTGKLPKAEPKIL